MPIHICQACGTSFAEAPIPPPCCPICEDERQYVPRTGQCRAAIKVVVSSS